jgi:hypothetical protein
VEQIIGAFVLTATARDAKLCAIKGELISLNLGLGVSFGATRPLPFEHVTEFLRASTEKGEDICPVHSFLNIQFRPISWPSLRLRFKKGQAMWVALRQDEWMRATVTETNTELGNLHQLSISTHVAAYAVHLDAMTPEQEQTGALGGELPIVHDCDRYIRKKRPPPPPAPGPAPEDARVVAERREAHDRREAMVRAGELEHERQRKARAKEEKRRKEEEEERRRLSSVHAAQAAARAATRELAPWPADMPLRGEGSDAPARARRETEKAEALARVSEHRARLCERRRSARRRRCDRWICS